MQCLNLWFNHLNRILSFGNLGEIFLFDCVNRWNILIKWIFENRHQRGTVLSLNCEMIIEEELKCKHTYTVSQVLEFGDTKDW